MERKPIIEVKDLRVYFYTYAGIVKAIEGVSFTVYKGEKFCIVGETGCGKTVVSRALTRSIPPPGRIVGGEIKYYRDGETIDIINADEKTLRNIRGNEIAYIIQDPASALDPLYTIGYQAVETMADHGKIKDWKNGYQRTIHLLKRVFIPDAERRVKSYPHELSGGMKQRAVISIGLSNNPRILIADEPTSYLDVTVQAQVLNIIRRLKEKEGLTLILITHDMGVVAEMCDRVAVLYAGMVAEIGPVDRIFANPLHPYTRGLLRAVPNPMKKTEKLESIAGNVPNLIFPPSGCRFHPRCSYRKKICEEKRPPLIEVEDNHYTACWLYSRGE